jgi:hypothetical protein
MAAVKMPVNYLAFAMVGAGIPLGTIDSVPTDDDQMAGLVTPPHGHILIREIPYIISDTTITVDKTPV